MPLQVSGTYADVAMLQRVITNQSFYNNIYTNQVAAVSSVGITEFARQYGGGYGGLSEEMLSTMVLTNLGLLPNADLQAELKNYLVSVGKANVGIVALQLGKILSGLEGATGDQAIYAAAAVRWNNEVNASYAYSSNPTNISPGATAPGFPVGTGSTLVLTSGNDDITGTQYDDVFLAPVPGMLASADTINSGGESEKGDTLKATLSAGEMVVPRLLMVAKVFITAGDGAQFSAERSHGMLQLWIDAAATAVTFKDVNLATTVGIQNSLSGGALTVRFAGASGALDSANITLADAAGADDVIVPGIELLSVRSVAGNVASTTANTARITTDSAEEIRIWGDQGLITTVTGAHVEVINASGLTGALDLEFATTGVTPAGIIGGTAGDRINVNDASGGRVAIDGGGGADTVTIGAFNVHAITLGGGADMLNILGLAGATAKDLDISSEVALGRSAIRVTDFESGVDLVRLAGAVSTAKAAPSAMQLASIAASASLLDAAALAATTAGAHKAVAFRYGADTYILVNDAAVALGPNDSLIKLSGVVALADASWTVA